MRLSAPIFRLKRQARLLARADGVPLHVALDRVARGEGFRAWSHLAASASAAAAAAGDGGRALLAALAPGDLVLLGGRPGHGKTLMGLELAAAAGRAGRPAFFFTLEDDEALVRARLRALGAEPDGSPVIVDTSDAISAEHVIARLGGAGAGSGGGAVAVIDYLQLLDQRRSNPPLAEQVRALRAFAGATGAIVVALSQIDRTFATSGRRFPELGDVRLPNPVDLGLFTRACFLHDGEARFAGV
ncbi:DNA helicase [Sphingomonas parva]|uniref:DNA helicase n=1 Tax=Sphingomonas parva TaxID=2555898 RepID=A0A4Y8ZMZ8_9SPHN|nr:DNA helicase [Sphingomonas parva]TFI56642.1 DNA helicase [Sphingomonas parva]